MSTSIFVVLIGYYHIHSQRGRVPMHVQARRSSKEGDMGGAGPNQMKMLWLQSLAEIEVKIRCSDHMVPTPLILI
jgi:hypothetical protein